jgi:hypothetical protein
VKLKEQNIKIHQYEVLEFRGSVKFSVVQHSSGYMFRITACLSHPPPHFRSLTPPSPKGIEVCQFLKNYMNFYFNHQHRTKSRISHAIHPQISELHFTIMTDFCVGVNNPK